MSRDESSIHSSLEPSMLDPSMGSGEVREYTDFHLGSVFVWRCFEQKHTKTTAVGRSRISCVDLQRKFNQLESTFAGILMQQESCRFVPPQCRLCVQSNIYRFKSMIIDHHACRNYCSASLTDGGVCSCSRPYPNKQLLCDPSKT